jgi:hypothetical protein
MFRPPSDGHPPINEGASERTSKLFDEIVATYEDGHSIATAWDWGLYLATSSPSDDGGDDGL